MPMNRSCIDSVSVSVKDSVTWTHVLVGLRRICRCVPTETLARHVGMFGILGYSSSTLEQVEIISLFGVSESHTYVLWPSH